MKANMSAEEYAAHVAKGTTEAQLQKAVVRTLRSLGYRKPNEVARAMEKPDPKCHALFWETMDAKGNRNDAGLPDILVSPAGYSGMVGIELKRPKGGRLSPAQAVAVACNVYEVAKSVEEVLAIVERAERGEA